jgi:flagellin
MSSIGSILSNAGALAALNGIAQTQNAAGSLDQQLSTGLSINSPADNPAGFIEAQGLTSQMNGLTQSAQNLNEGVSMLQTAQGAVTQQLSILQKLNSIAVAAANGTMTSQQRIADQGVVSSLLGQVNSIANQTQYNGINLLNGSLTGLQFQSGAAQSQTLTLSLPGTRASSLAVAKATAHAGSYVSQISKSGFDFWQTGPGSAFIHSASLGINGAGSNQLTIKGSKGSATISSSQLNTASGFIAGVIKNTNADSSKTGVTAYGGSFNVVFNTKKVTSGSININRPSGASFSPFSVSAHGSNGAFVASFNSKNTNSSLSATLTSSGNVEIKSSKAELIQISHFGSSSPGSVGFIGSHGSSKPIGATGSGFQNVDIGGQIHFKSAGNFTLSGVALPYIGLSSKAISTGGGSSVPKSSGASAPAPNLSAINVLSQTAAQNSIATIQNAINQLGQIQGYLGASQQRFQAQIGLLQTTNTNTQNGLAVVQDVNIPQATQQLTQEQIQNQAGVAALKSSTSLQQTFLSLLP